MNNVCDEQLNFDLYNFILKEGLGNFFENLNKATFQEKLISQSLYHTVKKNTLMEKLNLQDWVHLIIKDGVLTFNEIQKSNYPDFCKRYFSKNKTEIKKYLNRINGRKFRKISSRTLVNVALQDNIRSYVDLGYEIRAEIERRRLKKVVQKKMKAKRSIYVYRNHKQKYLDSGYELCLSHYVLFIKDNSVKSITDLYSINAFVHERIRKQLKSNKKRVMRLLGPHVDVTINGIRKTSNLSVREITLILLEEYRKTKISNLKKINYEYGQRLSRYGNYWIARAYINVETGNFIKVRSEMLRWDKEKALEFFKKMEIIPNSEEWQMFSVFFSLKPGLKSYISENL